MERLKFSLKGLDNIQDGKIDLPKHSGDAGYDIYAASAPKIKGEIYQGYFFKNISYIEYETNVSIEPSSDDYSDYDFYSLLFPRSSISKYNLSLCNSVGVIDSGYRDTIKIRFKYIPQPENYTILDGKHMLLAIDNSKIYQKGDRIAQVIFSKHIHPRIEEISGHSSSSRGKGGFGSTGKW